MVTGFKCRSCGQGSGEVILDLGVQPLANNLPRAKDAGEAEPRFPLRLAVCTSCWLMQIVDLLPPVQLFSEYVYFSSISESWVKHTAECARRYRGEFGLNEKDFVVEVASNDGCLLRHFAEAGIPHLGIEPAKNVATVASEHGVETRVDFFTEPLARELAATQPANLILANNVFAHAPDINDFTAGLAALLAEDGVAVLEFPHALEMIERVEFDTIYHEHVFYFSLTALQPLLARRGLVAWRVERLATHGGSLRLYLAREGARPVEESVAAVLAIEEVRGMGGMGFYRQFVGRVEAIREALCAEVSKWNVDGEVAAYGAAAKGSTLLNYCGLDAGTISFVVDRSPHKQGKFMPGAQIPILPVEELAARQPAAALMLAWNFAEEILAQQAAYREAGGKFIIPIPEVRVV